MPEAPGAIPVIRAASMHAAEMQDLAEGRALPFDPALSVAVAGGVGRVAQGGIVVIGRALLVAGILAAALAVAPGARADEAPYSMELWNGLMSPYCPGRTLMDCPSGQATELRDWIAEQEQAGRSKQEVEDELYAQFGDVILQAPKAQGFGIAAYLLPILALFAGGGIVWVFLRRQVAAGATTGEPALRKGPAVLDPEIERRIDEELRA